MKEAGLADDVKIVGYDITLIRSKASTTG